MTTQGFDKIADTLWRFVRGDMSASEFEAWVYRDETIETFLGPEVYLDLISVDFGSEKSTREIGLHLKTLLLEKFPDQICRCVRLADSAIVDMGEHEEIFKTLIRTNERGKPYWWLYTCQCSQCSTHWLVGSEERQNDVFCLRRLSAEESKNISARNLWPDYFDAYESLLQMGKDFGRSVRFLDPLNSLSLSSTIEDLAKNRPGIRLSELTSLLNLDAEIAQTLALKAVADAGVEITLDHQ